MEGRCYKSMIALWACLVGSAIVLQGCMVGGGDAVCCQAMTASCLACKKKVSKKEYCEDHPDTHGCAGDDDEGGTVCCQAMTASCIACQKSKSVKEVCEDEPDTHGCENKECPEEQPDSGHKCEHEGTSCNYDLHTCPDGSSQHITFADCRNGKWRIAMAGIVCAKVKDCPKEAPEPFSNCTKDLAGETCSYDIIECPDGSKHPTTYATCDKGNWHVTMAIIRCNLQSSRLYNAESLHIDGSQISMPFVFGASSSLMVAGAFLVFVVHRVARQPAESSSELLSAEGGDNSVPVE